MNLSRRRLLQGAAACSPFLGRSTFGAQSETLRGAASSHQLQYGCAVQSGLLRSDTSYAELVRTQAGILVAEGETKRKAVQPVQGRFDFSGADYILDFAQKNGQDMRGHTLAWYQSNPDWLIEALNVPHPDERLLTDYIQTIVSRYKNNFTSWDVVNEPINLDQGQALGMRTECIWYKAFGERYIDLAFHAARSADPHVPLYLNELDLEIDVRWSSKSRIATLNLLDRLISRKVPVDGLGIQGHLKAFLFSYSDKIISDFFDEVAARGLKIMITEFDIADTGGPIDRASRDMQVASVAKRFLDVAFSKKATQGCVTWGITDRYSWLTTQPRYKWLSGQFVRGLPFDESYKSTPMFEAMMSSLRK